MIRVIHNMITNWYYPLQIYSIWLPNKRDTKCTNDFINGVSVEIDDTPEISLGARGVTNLKVICGNGTVLEGSNNDKNYATTFYKQHERTFQSQ